MIDFQRYPHVKDFIEYYSDELSCPEIKELLKTGVNSERDAETLSRFVWKMVDKMLSDCDEGKEVFGQVDNSDVFPDIQYEVTLYLTKQGYMAVWNSVRNQENKRV